MHSSMQAESLCSAVHLSVNVHQYMFCHPETVVVRRGRPRVLRWQHLIGAQDLILQIKHSVSGGQKIESLGLHLRQLTLEKLCPLSSMIQNHHLFVTWHDSWVAFKWTTKKGNTQFQVLLASEEEAKQLVHLLHQSGCSVGQFRGTFLTERVRADMTSAAHPDADATLTNNMSTSGILEAQRTKPLDVYSDAPTPLASQHSLPRTYEPKYIEWHHPRVSQPLCDASQTQVVPMRGVGAPSVFSGVSDPSSRSCRSASAMSIGVSTRSKLKSLFGAGSFWCEPPASPEGEKAVLRRLDIPDIVRRKRALHLALESYAFAELLKKRVGWKEGSKWYHVGLVSDLCLSLVPASGSAAQPLVVLTRASTVLAEFVPHPSYLKAYYADGILGLRQRDTLPGNVCCHVQLQMMPVHLAVTRHWLQYWEVKIEDKDAPVLTTESTHCNSE